MSMLFIFLKEIELCKPDPENYAKFLFKMVQNDNFIPFSQFVIYIC